MTNSQTPKGVTLTKGDQTRTFDTPEAVVKARHDGWVPKGTDNGAVPKGTSASAVPTVDDAAAAQKTSK